MTVKEQRILKSIRKGDIAAFEELFHQFYPGMCSYAASIVKSDVIAEEIVQDTFYNIWKNKAVLNISSSWQSYLYRATYNNSVMSLRRKKRELSLDERWEDSKIAQENPADELDVKELNAIILYTLHKLPERTQLIFRLNRFEGLKYKEIAEKLSISVKTVEANMGKALKALRESLTDYSKTA